jgi:hypothetical protein
MNRYDVFVILSLIILIVSPIVLVTYTFTEPANLPLMSFIGVWPVDQPLVFPSSVAVLFGFAWIIISLIQAFNIANITRGKYNLVLAWILLVLTAAIQYFIVTEFVIPHIEFWRNAYRRVDVNVFPQLLLNSPLLIYTLLNLGNKRVINSE